MSPEIIEKTPRPICVQPATVGTLQRTLRSRLTTQIDDFRPLCHSLLFTPEWPKRNLPRLYLTRCYERHQSSVLWRLNIALVADCTIRKAIREYMCKFPEFDLKCEASLDLFSSPKCLKLLFEQTAWVGNDINLFSNSLVS